MYLYSGFSVYMERRVSMTEVNIRSTCSEGFFIAYTMRETNYSHFTQRPPINHKQLQNEPRIVNTRHEVIGSLHARGERDFPELGREVVDDLLRRHDGGVKVSHRVCNGCVRVRARLGQRLVKMHQTGVHRIVDNALKTRHAVAAVEKQRARLTEFRLVKDGNNRCCDYG